MGAGSLLATYSFMGPIFAVYRAIAAFVSGIVGGVLVGSLDRGEDTTSPDERSGDAAISNCNVCNEPETRRVNTTTPSLQRHGQPSDTVLSIFSLILQVTS